MKKHLLSTGIFVCCFIIAALHAHAQKTDNHDSSYFDVFPRTFTARIYGIHKYSQLTIPSSGSAEDIQYRPNTKYGIGIGGTYNNFTLNIAIAPGAKKDNDEKGKTKSINLQIHAFPVKWTVDVLAVSHKGEYIFPKDFNGANASKYYIRPDVKSSLFGVAAYRISNAKQFSYRAAVVQNEWQKKSSGSFLLGGQAYYGQLKGDSSLIPPVYASSFKQTGIDKINLLTVGPGVGYAYTLVAAQHFYIMASLIANLDVNFTTEYAGGSSENKTGIAPAAVFKTSAGYNSSTWGVVANWEGNAVLFKGKSSSKSYFLPAGLFNVAISKKIEIKRK